MKRNTKQRSTEKLLADLNDRLNDFIDNIAWLIRAENRFRVGQRVKFSKTAQRKGIPDSRRKSNGRGTVVGVYRFTVKVKLDGYAKPLEFHHKFFNPVGGPEVF